MDVNGVWLVSTFEDESIVGWIEECDMTEQKISKQTEM